MEGGSDPIFMGKGWHNFHVQPIHSERDVEFFSQIRQAFMSGAGLHSSTEFDFYTAGE